MLDAGSPRLSWRRLWSLIGNLPRESRYAQATAGDQVQWGYTEHLLATVIDVLQVHNWQFASVHAKGRVEKPKPLQRPGVVPVNQRRFGSGRYTMAEMRVLLDSRRARTEEVD